MHRYHPPILQTLILIGTLLPAAARGQTAVHDAAGAARTEALRAAGVHAPLTLYPVRVLGRPDVNVAEAMGLVLERSGMLDLSIGEPAFDPGDAAWDAVPALLAAHVKRQDPGAGARYAMFAEFLGTPKSGPTEVRFVVVDSKGDLVLQDHQTPADPTFKRTAGRDPDPLGCSMLVGERLFALAGWQKGDVRGGKFAERWRLKSGAPDKADLAAIEQRRATLRADLKQARIAVLPTLFLGKPDQASAARLAQQVTQEFGCQATALVDVRSPEATPSSNEQKRLWGLAAALRKQLASSPIAADYAVVVDALLRPDGKASSVHVIVTTRAGDVVVADYQNDQHPMFQKHAPRTVEDAEKLAVARLASLLR